MQTYMQANIYAHKIKIIKKIKILKLLEVIS